MNDFNGFGCLVGGNLFMGQGGLCQYDPALYQQQGQAYQQVTYQQQIPRALPMGVPKAEKYVPEYSWLRGRVNEILWK